MMEVQDNVNQLAEMSRQLRLKDDESQEQAASPDQFDQFEQTSRKLYLHDTEEFKSVGDEVYQYIYKFFTAIPTFKAYENNFKSSEDIFKHNIAGKGISFKKILELFHNSVINGGSQPTSGSHMGYIPSGGLPLSSFGDFIAAFTNKYSTHYTTCPGGVNLEKLVLEWAASLFGYDKKTFGGNLCSGASVATVMCLAAARDKHGIKAREYEHAVIYTSEQVHFCLEKALKLIGMRESILRKIPVDALYRINTSVLELTIAEDISNGLKPFVIVGTLGATHTGSVDEMDKLSKLAQKFDCWFHVDAAYGGFFCLLSEMKELFKGVENSDSLCCDPHKSLFLPFGSGIMLVKNRNDLLRSFSYSSVLIDQIGNETHSNFSPELSRNFRGLRMWFPLLYHGVDLFADGLREKVMLTRYAYDEMKKLRFIELGARTPLTAFIFRYNGFGIYKGSELNDVKYLNTLNKEMNEAFLEDGRVFLTTTTLNGVFWLRVAVLCIRTHKRDMDRLIDMVRFHFEQRHNVHNVHKPNNKDIIPDAQIFRNI